MIVDSRRLALADQSYVLAKADLYRALEVARREELALYEVPIWRVFRAAKQRSRLLDARVALQVAQARLARAERDRDLALGAA